MNSLSKITVPNEIEDIRLYDYCLGKFEQLPSRKSVKKAIDKGKIFVNNKIQKTGYWLKGGEQIELFDLEQNPPKPYRLKLEIIFEDEHLIIVNKPSGIVVSGNQFKTLFNALAYNFTISKEKDALKWPLPVHRLDLPTSGLIISAKTTSARIELGRQFENRSIQKTYHALVMGETPNIGKNDTDIEAKDALTTFKTIKRGRSLRSSHLSLLEINPKTGRKHQIRIHLSQMNFPILGDLKYGPSKNTLRHKGLFLSATTLHFNHPISKKALFIQISPPKKFIKRLESEHKRWKSSKMR